MSEQMLSEIVLKTVSGGLMADDYIMSRQTISYEIAALETKLKAIMQALKIADERNIDSEVGFYIGMAFMAAQDALSQHEKA